MEIWIVLLIKWESKQEVNLLTAIWMNEQMDTWMNVWMDVWMDACMEVKLMAFFRQWIVRSMYMDGYKNEWMNEKEGKYLNTKNEQICLKYFFFSITLGCWSGCWLPHATIMNVGTYVSPSWFFWQLNTIVHNITVNFLQNIHKRHPIACPDGQTMGCLFWDQSMKYVAPRSQQSCMQYIDELGQERRNSIANAMSFYHQAIDM